MSNTNNTLLLRKRNGSTVGNVVSTLAEWNIACRACPFKDDGESKEIYTNNWKDEHGEEAYIPSVVYSEAYDLEVSFAYKGAVGSAYPALKSFRDYLRGNDGDGAELEIYSPYTGIGRKKCYLKSFPEKDFFQSNVDEGLEFTVTFRVTDPVTDVTLSL